MKTIPIKTTRDKFYRQVLEVLGNVPPINKLRPKEKDVLAELMYQFDNYKSYPEQHRRTIIYSNDNRKVMREKIGIGADSFNNNISILRRHKILIKNDELHPFFTDILFDGEFKIGFLFKE